MKVPIIDAQGRLADLVRRAQDGEQVALTVSGRDAVRLVPVKSVPDRASRRALLEAVRASGAAKPTPGPVAAPSQDFLYGNDGLPS